MPRLSPEKEKWLEAMNNEFRQLGNTSTWELTNLPSNCKAIGNQWVYRVKRDAQGSVVKYKARLTAQGFSQVPGVDYQETFAPTPAGQLSVPFSLSQTNSI